MEHNHEDNEEMEYINLTLDSGEEVEHAVIGTFEVGDKNYMALLNEDEDVYLYQYEDINEEEVDLINIEDDGEFEAVSEAFMDLFAEED